MKIRNISQALLLLQLNNNNISIFSLSICTNLPDAHTERPTTFRRLTHFSSPPTKKRKEKRKDFLSMYPSFLKFFGAWLKTLVQEPRCSLSLSLSPLPLLSPLVSSPLRCDSSCCLVKTTTTTPTRPSWMYVSRENFTSHYFINCPYT